jgi:hypothetical protein
MEMIIRDRDDDLWEETGNGLYQCRTEHTAWLSLEELADLYGPLRVFICGTGNA